MNATQAPLRGRITQVSETSRAGAWDTLILRYEAGPVGLPTGAAVRVQLPDTWHAWVRNGAKGMHSVTPQLPNFVSALARSSSVRLRCEVEGGDENPIVKSNRTGLDGRSGRYVYVVRVTVAEGQLAPGGVIDIIYGDKSHGGPGFSAAIHPNGRELVRASADIVGDGSFELLPDQDCPLIEVKSGPAAELLLLVPTVLGPGEEGSATIAVLDSWGNAVDDIVGVLDLQVLQGESTLPERVPLSLEDQGVKSVPFRGHSGVIRVSARLGALAAVSNPCDVRDEAPEARIYWGDLHSHSELSFDGVGSNPYTYARDVAALDFCARTEHCEGWSGDEWSIIRREAAELDDPGKFVPLLAYEATFAEPWGHHNVYFRDLDGPIVGAHNGTLIDLWAALDDRRALTIPHHTGVEFSPTTAGSIPGSRSPNPDWSHHNASLRRSIEIFSGHGTSELFDRSDELAYENSLFSTNTSREGPHYAVDAWIRGLELGVVAASDNHRAQPGRGELGLTAVSATRLDRSAIFDALWQRSTYGTTGARMFIDFTVDGAAMGTHSVLGRRRQIDVRILGTSPIAHVEVVGGHYGRSELQVVFEWRPWELDFCASWTDTNGDWDFYYVRVLEEGRYRGRPKRGWSSPVWVSKGSSASKSALNEPVRVLPYES